jgi:ferredoxin
LVLDGRASIAQELCVHCSKCLESCPLEAIRLGDKPIIEVNDPSLNYHVKSSWCTGCGDCISDCLENAISIVSGKAVIDTELCSQCGICKSTCSEEAIYQGDKIPFKYFVTSCKGCQRCVYPCPSDAIYMSNGKAIINQDKCTKCGECVNDCPWGLIKKI